ncbi:hypothetical protein Tco_0647132 [Tanacetum coccineum]
MRLSGKERETTMGRDLSDDYGLIFLNILRAQTERRIARKPHDGGCWGLLVRFKRLEKLRNGKKVGTYMRWNYVLKCGVGYHVMAIKGFYADLKRKPMEFQVGDKLCLKFHLGKGVVRFGKWGKLNPRYVDLLKVLKPKVGALLKALRFLKSEAGFKWMTSFICCEEPVEIHGSEVKQLSDRESKFARFDGNFKAGLEFTWECEDQSRKKYPHLFTKTALCHVPCL